MNENTKEAIKKLKELMSALEMAEKNDNDDMAFNQIVNIRKASSDYIDEVFRR